MVTLEISGGHGRKCFCLIDYDGNVIIEEADSAEAAAQSFAETGDQLVNEICQKRKNGRINPDDVTDLITFNCPTKAISEFLTSLLNSYQDQESLIMDSLKEDESFF